MSPAYWQVWLVGEQLLEQQSELRQQRWPQAWQVHFQYSSTGSMA